MIRRRTQSNRLIWGRRPRRSSPRSGHARLVRATVGEPAVSFAGPARTRRQGGPSQDRALYACSCGHVFHALVSTSVDCPECGSTQAW